MANTFGADDFYGKNEGYYDYSLYCRGHRIEKMNFWFYQGGVILHD